MTLKSVFRLQVLAVALVGLLTSTAGIASNPGAANPKETAQAASSCDANSSEDGCASDAAKRKAHDHKHEGGQKDEHGHAHGEEDHED